MSKNNNLKNINIKPLFSLSILCLFFILSTIIFSLLARNEGYYSIFNQLIFLCRYMYLSLIFIILFKFINIFYQNLKIEEKNKETKAPKDIAENQDKEQGEKNLFTVEKIEENSQKKEEKDIFELCFCIMYIVFQISLTVLFLVVGIISYPFLFEANPAATSFLSMIIFLVLPVLSFAFQKYTKIKNTVSNKNAEANTISGYTILFNLVCIAAAFLSLLYIVFEVNYLYILSWVYWIAFIYLAISIIVNVSIAAIKKQTLDNFDYKILPNFFKKGKLKNLFSLFEKNTGLSFKSLWSIKYFLSLLPTIVFIALLVLFLSSAIYKIEPYQQGVIYRFGKLQESVQEPGLHLKFPFPIDEIEIYNTKRVQNIQIGYVASEGNDFLWDREHDGGEYKLLLGDGNELVSVNVELVYNINNLNSYVLNNSNPENLLSAKAYEVLMERTVSSNLDTFLCVDRSELGSNIENELNSYSEDMQLGLFVNEVIIESIHPPVEIATAYQRAVSAEIEKSTLITEATTTGESTIIDAEKISGQAVIDAEANQFEEVSLAAYEMAVYYAAFEAYSVNPENFQLCKYLSTYEKVINGSKIYVFSPNIDGDLSDYIINGNNYINTIIGEEDEE